MKMILKVRRTLHTHLARSFLIRSEAREANTAHTATTIEK